MLVIDVWVAEKNWRLGKWYKTEGGFSLKILSLENMGPRPLITTNPDGEITRLTSKGYFHPDGREHPSNLTIEMCPNPFKVHACPTCHKIPVVNGSSIYCKYKSCKLKARIQASSFDLARIMWNRSMRGIRDNIIQKKPAPPK